MTIPFLNRPEVRALARRLGIASSGGRLLKMISGDTTSFDLQYEAQFGKVLLESVSQGDCVWDVGANVGYFTTQLAERVGESGRVLAFEPFKSTFDRLQAETQRFSQVQCFQLALGAEDRSLFVDGAVESPSNNLMRESSPLTGEQVRMTTGSRLIRDGEPAPAVIKIDVEGFEEDVVWGFRDVLADSGCHTVLMEVHYHLLDKRGFLRAPSRMVSLLRDMGFRTSWLDSGHLKASRTRK